MASKEDCSLVQERNEASNGGILSSGSSAESNQEIKNEYRRFTVSCPAIVEPSKDELPRSEISKNHLERVLASSCPEPTAEESSTDLSRESNSYKEEQQISNGYQSNQPQNMDEAQSTFCETFKDCYNKYARKIGNSCFIYIFQCFVSLLAVSTIVMGIIHFGSCNGTYQHTEPFLVIFQGISVLPAIYKWVTKVYRERAGQRYWNREKNRLALCFIIALFFTLLEFIFFQKLVPNTLQISKDIKCDKTFYDFMFYLHIANAASLVLVALLYLPDSVVYISKWKHPEVSASNGHYQPL